MYQKVHKYLEKSIPERPPILREMERYAKETQDEVIAAWKDPASLESIRRYLEGVKEERERRSSRMAGKAATADP